MSGRRLGWPATTAVSLLAGLTTWVALWSWKGFVERPSGFLVPSLTACLLVAVTGMLLRSARVPALLVPLGQALVLLVWMVHLWAAEVAPGGWLPTADALAEVARTISRASAAAERYQAPVPEDVPEIYPLLVLGGAGVAVLVDLLACGLRRVPLAGLPLLAVYTVPVSILSGGVTWWGFAALAMCFLMLLATDEASGLARWGRQISAGDGMFDSQSTAVSTQGVRAAARKIGLTATGLAVVVPIFVPTITPNWFDGPGGGSGSGGEAVTISNPLVDLKRDLVRGADTNLVYVTTADPDPSYLRLTVLDEFDGKAWKPSERSIPIEQRAEGRLPRPPGLASDVPRSTIPYTLDVDRRFGSRWLPAPYPLSSLTAEGDWRYDVRTMDFVSAVKDQTAAGLEYSLDALALRTDRRDLDNAGPASSDIYLPNTRLPDTVPASVKQLARELTAGQESKFEKAVVLQQWFRRDGGFTYTLDQAPGNSVDSLTRFLGTGPGSREGYCEQFAASMAMMGRAIGIPSRVAVGFLRPDRIGPDRYVYSSHDLHAWPEMYFQGTGWIRFEPTPSDRAATVPDYTTGQAPAPVPSQDASSAAPTGQQTKLDRETQSPTTRPDGAGGSAVSGASLLAGFVGALVVLALLAAPRAARAWIRRRRWAGADTPVALAEAAWGELRDSALDLGVPWDDTVTLRTRARGLVRSFGEPGAARDGTQRPRTGAEANPDATQALDRLVRYVEQARYARSVEAAPSVEADVEACVQALRDGTSRRRRTRATWLPASLANLGRRELQQRHRDEPPVLTEAGVDHAV